jgi:hypothetical protein
MALDAHVGSAHGVAAQSRDLKGAVLNQRLAGQAEIPLKVPLRSRGFRKTLDAFGDLYDALLALALLAARRGNLYTDPRGTIEE